jgi:hypothetical protein
VPQFRYRTAVLVGLWRDTRERACNDAVRAGQAKTVGDGEVLEWVVPGSIEQRDKAPNARCNTGARSS